MVKCHNLLFLFLVVKCLRKVTFQILLLMQNSIYKIKYLSFLSWDWEAWCLTVWGVNNPSLKETLLEIRGRNVFTA